MIITYRFDRIKRTGLMKGRCKCGKAVRRQRTFECTVNPFNRNFFGMVKTHAEVAADAQAKAAAWAKDVICAACESEPKAPARKRPGARVRKGGGK